MSRKIIRAVIYVRCTVNLFTSRSVFTSRNLFTSRSAFTSRSVLFTSPTLNGFCSLASLGGNWLPVLISFYSLHFVSRFPIGCLLTLDCVWNVMAHAQKPDFVFRRNGRVHLNRRGHQFRRLLAAEVCISAAVMLDTPCSEVVWRVLLATHSIRQFPLQFPSLRHRVPLHFNRTLLSL